MMLEKSYRSLSSCRRCVFSSTSRFLSSSTSRWILTACAMLDADDAEELDVAVVVAVRIELEIDAERADRAPVEQDRHADEAQLLLRQLRPLRRAVEERRLLAHARDDDRLAALDDLADDAFADAVAHRVRRRVEAVGGLDVQLAVVVQQRDEAAHGAVVLRQDLEHAVQRRSQVQRARQRLADLEQRREPPRLARVDRPPDRT